MYIPKDFVYWTFMHDYSEELRFWPGVMLPFCEVLVSRFRVLWVDLYYRLFLTTVAAYGKEDY